MRVDLLQQVYLPPPQTAMPAARKVLLPEITTMGANVGNGKPWESQFTMWTNYTLLQRGPSMQQGTKTGKSVVREYTSRSLDCKLWTGESRGPRQIYTEFFGGAHGRSICRGSGTPRATFHYRTFLPKSAPHCGGVRCCRPLPVISLGFPYRAATLWGKISGSPGCVSLE